MEVEVRLLRRTLDAVVAETGLPAEPSLAAAFRRGLALLDGTAAFPETGDAGLDEALRMVADLDAAEALDSWRVLHRQRRFEALEPTVTDGEDENRRLRERLLGARQIETLDLSAQARRIFSHREPSS